MKRFLSLFLTAVFFISNITVIGEKTNEPEVSTDVLAQQLGFCDFDSSSEFSGGGTLSYEDDEHKNVCDIPANGAVGLNFGKIINSGKVVMSYDIKFSAISYFLTRTFTEDRRNGVSSENIFVRNNGYAYLCKYNKQNSDIMPRLAYEKDKWYSVEIWYDFDTRIYKVYFDGKFLGQEEMSESITGIGSFGVYTIYNSAKVDNIGALYIPSNGVVDMKNYPFVHCYDNEYDNAVQPWIETGKLGDAFFGENIDFKLKLVNNQEFPTEGTVQGKYINADGVSQTKEKPFTLDGYANQEIEFDFKSDCYGYASLEASVFDKNGNLLGISAKDISVVKKGETNKKIGFADHRSNRLTPKGLDKQFELLKNMGAGSYRDGIPVNTIMDKNGTLISQDSVTQRFVNILENESWIKPLTLLQIHGGVDTALSTKIPLNDEQYSTWFRYVDEFLKLIKNIDEPFIEIGNEFNYAIKSEPDKYNSKMYYELCKKVYPIIKQANPNAKVFTISSGSTGNTMDYVEELLKYGIADYSDGFTFHPYDVYHSTENDDTLKMVEDLHNLLKKYGAEDKPIIYSEYGWTTAKSTGVTDERKARYVPQASILLTDYIETINFYNFIKKNTYGDFEDNFGFLENDLSEVPYKPTESFMSLANYNSLMPNVKNLKKYDYANGDVTVCSVENERGTRSIMAWVKENKPDTNISIDIGCSNAEIYDIYGNGTKIKTENGKVNLSLGQDPIYIIGDIGDISESKSNIYVNERNLELVENDIAYVTGKLPDNSYEIETVCPDNITADKAEIGEDGTFKVKLNIGSNENRFEKIRVRVKKDNEYIYCSQIKVSYTKAIGVKTSVIYYKDSYWRLKIKITNKSNSMKLSGNVVLTEPDDFEIPSSQSKFENIAPGASKYIYINISPKYTKKKMDLKGYVETSHGEKVDFSDTSYFVGLMYLDKEPTIDGKISEGEYNFNAPISLNTKDYVVHRAKDYPGLEETSGYIYLNYDEYNLYLAAKIYDSVEGATGDSSMVWQNDSIQLALAEEPERNAARTEYCIGKDNKGVPTITRYAFIGTKTVAAGGEGDAVEMGENIKLEIGRDGMYTIYEFRIPWTEVFGEDRPVLDRRDLLFSALINDNDGLGRTGYVEFCPGIGGEKNPAEFSKIQAMK